MTVHAAAPGPLVARTVAIDDPGDLIAAMPEPGISWVRRGEGMVAWGEAARIDTRGAERIDAAQVWWRLLCRHAVVRDDVRTRGTGLVAFGSFAFSDSSPTGGSLVVPRFVMGRRDGSAWFTTISRETDAEVGPEEALASAVAPKEPGEVRLEEGDEAAWTTAVESAVGRIREGELEKVVLARAVEARAERPVDVRLLLGRLAAEYPMCWAFHVDGLVGATPELLARVDHGLVTSRVLAGTIRMTGDDMGDLARAGALARSSKDREEHEYAARSVTQALAAHCASVNIPDEPSVLHLPNVMHLATDVTGVLSHNVASLELVSELHPTAAVCGTPTLGAARVIDELEGLDRGRYAGPVGWTDSTGDGEWCIGLRSAELSATDPRRLRLFAGCGIVAASEPESEWAESEAKLEPVRLALGISHPEPEIPVAAPPEPVAAVEEPAAVEEESPATDTATQEAAPVEAAAVAEEATATEPSAPAEEATPAEKAAEEKPPSAAEPAEEKAAPPRKAVKGRSTPTRKATRAKAAATPKPAAEPAEPDAAEAPTEQPDAAASAAGTDPTKATAKATEEPAAGDAAPAEPDGPVETAPQPEGAEPSAPEVPVAEVDREPRVEFDPKPLAITGGATFEDGGEADFPTLRVDPRELGQIPSLTSGAISRPRTTEVPTPTSWDSAEWEERYRSRDAVWSSEPNAQLVAEAAQLTPGRALDAGCGEGADAVHLALHGWSVTAVDISETAIERARQRAVRESVAGQIEWRVADVASAGLRVGGYDLVTAHYAHPEDGIASLVRVLARHVSPGGVLLVVGHDPRDSHVAEHPRLSRTAFRAEDAALGLDPEVWEVEVAEVRERGAEGADGEAITRLDSVLRARRIG